MRGPARGLGVYREVLAVPGAALFVTAGALARLPISMLGIGIVLLIAAEYGSYQVAGAVSGAYLVLASVCGPVLARAVDRLGQARVMRPAIAVHLAGLVALLVAATAHAPVAVVLAAVAVMGASSGSVGSLVRARWLHVLSTPEAAVSTGAQAPAAIDTQATGGGSARGVAAGGELLEARVHTAFSLESVVDEVVFIVGPLVVTVLATTASPVLGLAVAGAALGTGGALLLAQRTSEPPPVPGRAHAGSGVLRAPGMVLLMVVFLAAGAVFGSVELVTVAFTSERGVPGAAGPVLAGYAIGSLVAGLAYGAVGAAGSPARRFFHASLLFAAGVLPLAVVSTVPALAAVLVVAGLAISPTLIAGNALVRRLVDPARLTEGLTWVGTALGIGVAAGAALGGQWVEDAGARSALALPVVCGIVVAVVALGGRSRLVGAAS